MVIGHLGNDHRLPRFQRIILVVGDLPDLHRIYIFVGIGAHPNRKVGSCCHRVDHGYCQSPHVLNHLAVVVNLIELVTEIRTPGWSTRPAVINLLEHQCSRSGGSQLDVDLLVVRYNIYVHSVPAVIVGKTIIVLFSAYGNCINPGDNIIYGNCSLRSHCSSQLIPFGKVYQPHVKVVGHRCRAKIEGNPYFCTKGFDFANIGNTVKLVA
ncbi:hypothetical protein SDC9_161268 [bioreactor metagenome]|uniref:Uncharacterized protein n=1 Tax=bioreactor metagenome TaxID=1076179 RepID=A0A645FK53_9ZZZZ